MPIPQRQRGIGPVANGDAGSPGGSGNSGTCGNAGQPDRVGCRYPDHLAIPAGLGERAMTRLVSKTQSVGCWVRAWFAGGLRHRLARLMPPAAAALALGSIAASAPGCAALHPIRGVPVDELALDLMTESRTNKATIDLSLLTRSQPEEYRVGPEDILSIYVPGVLGTLIDRDDETGETPPINIPQDGSAPPTVGFPLQVRGDGTLSLPQVEPIDVEGLTLRQVEKKIVEAYTVENKILSAERPRVIVSLQQPRTYEVLVVRQEKTDEVSGSGAGNGQVNVGRSRRGTARLVRLPAYQNDVLHALAVSEDVDGLPGLDARNTIYVIRRRGSQQAGLGCELAADACGCDPLAAPGAAIGGGMILPEGTTILPGTELPPMTPMPMTPLTPATPLPTPADAVEAPPSESEAEDDAREPAPTRTPSSTRRQDDLRQALPQLPAFSALPAPPSEGGGMRATAMPLVPLQTGYEPPATLGPLAPQTLPAATQMAPPLPGTLQSTPGTVRPAGGTVAPRAAVRPAMQIIPRTPAIRGQQPTGFAYGQAYVVPDAMGGMEGLSVTPAKKPSMLSRLNPWAKPSRPQVSQRPSPQPSVFVEADGRITGAAGHSVIAQQPVRQPVRQSATVASQTAVTPTVRLAVADSADAAGGVEPVGFKNMKQPLRQFRQDKRRQRAGKPMPPQHVPVWHDAVASLDPTVENPSVIKIPVRLSPGERPNICEQDIILNDGDIVFIESRDTEVFYTGGLLGGGQYELPRDYDLRLLEAISIAQSPQNVVTGRSPGGSTALNADVEYSGSRVIVMRQLPGGSRVPIEISIYDALRDPQEHNIVIQPGDFILVQYTKAEAWVAFIQQNLLEASIFTSAFTLFQTQE